MAERIKRGAKLQNAQNANYSGAQELADSENGLIQYSSEIVKKLMKFSAVALGSSKKVLEFGAGNGFLANIWKDGQGHAPDCVEIDPTLIEMIRKRDMKCYPSLNECPGEYDVIYTSNVLEHIEDDLEALKSLCDKLIPNGILAIYVPAFPALFSDMDRSVGHFRRYRRKELIEKVKMSGFQVEKCIYDDFLGFFASITVKILGYKSSTKLGSLKTLQFYDSFIYPISRQLDALFTRKLLGKNLLLIARKLD